MPLFLKSLAVWLGLMVLAVLNGGLREGVLVSALGPATASLVSGLLLSLVVLLMALATIRWLSPRTAAQAWLIGVIWLVLTLMFEFSFGGWVQHQSLAQMLRAYTFEAGNIWPLVLVVILLAPVVARRLRMGAGQLS